MIRSHVNLLVQSIQSTEQCSTIFMCFNAFLRQTSNLCHQGMQIRKMQKLLEQLFNLLLLLIKDFQFVETRMRPTRASTTLLSVIHARFFCVLKVVHHWSTIAGLLACATACFRKVM